MKRLCLTLLIGGVCAACEQRQPTDQVANISPAANEVMPIDPGTIKPGEPGGPPDDRNLAGDGPIDPRSAQGAGLVLQSYATLIEQRRYAEAGRLWSAGGRASEMTEEEFAEAHGKYAELHAEIGAPGAVEGAAGSAYVDIPVRFYGRLTGGQHFNSAGIATLRRVNDVPGSTPAQRRWHIYKMEMQPPL